MPRWPGVVGTVASALGLGVAGYLTYEHFTSSSSLACSDNGVVNCLKVTTSSYSAVAGVPVAVLGLVFFVVMLVLQLPPMWRRPEPIIRLGRLAWAVVGLGTVLYLLYAELFAIDAICLWCTSVHVLTLVLFGTTVYATSSYPAPSTIDVGHRRLSSPLTERVARRRDQGSPDVATQHRDRTDDGPLLTLSASSPAVTAHALATSPHATEKHESANALVSGGRLIGSTSSTSQSC